MKSDKRDIPCPSCRVRRKGELSLRQHHARVHNESITSIVQGSCNDCGETQWTFYTETGIYYEGKCDASKHQEIDRSGEPSRARAEDTWYRDNYSWDTDLDYEPSAPLSIQQKERIREDRGRQCEDCGKAEEDEVTRLPIKHLDGNKRNNSDDNLLVLCRDCI